MSLENQTLEHTLGLPPEQWRVLAKAHTKRNSAEYDGDVDIDIALVEAVIRVASEMASRLKAEMIAT